MREVALSLIRIYQMSLSPFIGRSCRFDPTCSRYAYEAIEKYGFLKGVWLGVRRIARCNPLFPGGYDPVP